MDPRRFTGACYRAANWEEVGRSKGYERVRGGGYQEHGRPKTILVRELAKDARHRLSGSADPPAWGCVSPTPAPEAMEPIRLRSLYEHLRDVPEFRARRGLRHQLATVLAIALAAQLCGVSGVVPIAEFATRLNQRQLGAVRAWIARGERRRVAPGQTTFFRVLSSVDPDALDRVLRDWAASHCDPGGALALDGKRVRGASRQMPGTENCHLIAALEHGSGLVCGQVQVADKTNEIPAVRNLLGELELSGRIVTADAMHAHTETARLVLDKGADYLLTVKGNQAEILDDLRSPLRARRLLRRGPAPQPRQELAAQPRLPAQRRHLHCASARRIPLLAPSPSPLRGSPPTRHSRSHPQCLMTLAKRPMAL